MSARRCAGYARAPAVAWTRTAGASVRADTGLCLCCVRECARVRWADGRSAGCRRARASWCPRAERRCREVGSARVTGGLASIRGRGTRRGWPANAGSALRARLMALGGGACRSVVRHRMCGSSNVQSAERSVGWTCGWPHTWVRRTGRWWPDALPPGVSRALRDLGGPRDLSGPPRAAGLPTPHRPCGESAGAPRTWRPVPAPSRRWDGGRPALRRGPASRHGSA